MPGQMWPISSAISGAGRRHTSVWRWSCCLSAVWPRILLYGILGDVGVGLMTIFNMIVLFPMSGQALKALREYEGSKEKKRTKKMPAGEEIPVPAEQSAGEGGL